MNTKPSRAGCMGAGQIFNEAHLPAYLSLESEHYLSLLKEAGRPVEGVNIEQNVKYQAEQ